MPMNTLRHHGSMTPPSLASFTAYLSRAGWHRVDEDERSSLWMLGEGDLRIVLPLTQMVTDYAEVAEDALRVLAYVERRVPSEIVADMEFGGADTLAVRLTPDAPPGEAPLELACAAVEALRDLVVASASGLLVNSLVLPLRRPARAEQYVRRARLSTQSGSFVLSLALPLRDGLEEPGCVAGEDEGMLIRESDLPPAEPFGRRVTNRLLRAASVAAEIADAVNEGSLPISAFGEARAGAPNATELLALASLGGPERAAYQLRIARSPLAPGTPNSGPISISPGRQRVLAEASEYLRTKQPRTGVTVVGLVVRLFRGTQFGPGEVVVLGEDDDSGARRRYRVQLSEPDYNRAVDAHRKGLSVQVEGDLQVRGTRLSLVRPASFGVIPGIDDED